MNPEEARRIAIAIAKDQLAAAVMRYALLERAIREEWDRLLPDPWVLRELARGRLRAALGDRVETWDRYLTRQVNRSPVRQGMDRRAAKPCARAMAACS